MSTRPSAWPGTDGLAAPPFAGDVREGLCARPRRIPPRYLYDELGSSLFEAICRLPWYPITRAEKQLLATHGVAIARIAGHPLTIVELGCGTGEKLEILVEAFAAGAAPSCGETGLPADRSGPAGALPGADGVAGLRVVLIDVSAMALERSARLLRARGVGDVVPCQTTYEAGLAQASSAWPASGARLVLFLGSNVGNLEPGEAEAFLASIRGALREGDHLLLGADLVKPAGTLERAYDDPLGVTAAFNRNLLVRMNRELGADFDLEGFSHQALWNEEPRRVEMHLVSRRRQVVRIPGAASTFTFEAGESIWTESSYKYTPEGIATIGARAGFRPREMWVDEGAGFSLTLLGVR
jgi:dimethylhistidine N-methyltransferase